MLRDALSVCICTVTHLLVLSLFRSILRIVLWRTLSKNVIKYFYSLFQIYFLFILNIRIAFITNILNMILFASCFRKIDFRQFRKNMRKIFDFFSKMRLHYIFHRAIFQPLQTEGTVFYSNGEKPPRLPTEVQQTSKAFLSLIFTASGSNGAII